MISRFPTDSLSRRRGVGHGGTLGCCRTRCCAKPSRDSNSAGTSSSAKTSRSASASSAYRCSGSCLMSPACQLDLARFRQIQAVCRRAAAARARARAFDVLHFLVRRRRTPARSDGAVGDRVVDSPDCARTSRAERGAAFNVRRDGGYSASRGDRRDVTLGGARVARMYPASPRGALVAQSGAVGRRSR